MSAEEPNRINISIHAPMPEDECVAALLMAHMRELAGQCQDMGWEVATTLTLTKPGADPGGE